jgi:hypothetical protein
MHARRTGDVIPSYHGGDLNGNAIRCLMEHAEGIATGVKQKIHERGIDNRDTESMI